MEQWEEAREYYARAIQLQKVVEYYFNRANVYAKLQHYDEAIKDYKSCIKNEKDSHNDDMKLKAKFEQGNCLRFQGKIEDSITILSQAVEMKGDEPAV